MKTLHEAWDWYRSTKSNLERMQRLGTKHWTNFPDDAALWLDEKFKSLEADAIEEETKRALSPLEDLGILVLFSVFESNVRDFLEFEVRQSVAGLGHPILVHAAERALEGVEQGSFANNVLLPLQDQKRISANLCDRIKQVRDYRNWVAHGKREPRKNPVEITAREAFERLGEFLKTLGVTVEGESRRDRESISDESEGVDG